MHLLLIYIKNQIIVTNNTNEFDANILFKNLKLGVFNKDLENIYSSKQEINSVEYLSLDKSLTTLIKDAEKYLSYHIGNVIVLYDSTQYYSIDLCIKKVFDQEVDLTKVYNYLIEDAHFLYLRIILKIR